MRLRQLLECLWQPRSALAGEMELRPWTKIFSLDQSFYEPGVAIAVATLRCGTIMPLAISLLVTFGHFSATNGANDSCMQAMQLLALSGVMAATGAMISLTIAVSPPLTLLPPRSAPAEVNTQQQRTIESVGAAT